MTRRSDYPVLLLMFLTSLAPLLGQSRMPKDTSTWLQVTENPGDGGLDSVMTVFFEVPYDYSLPIYIGIRDPEGDDDAPDVIQTPSVGDDTNTIYQLFMGDNAYTGASARLVDYGAVPTTHDDDGTCPAGYTYEYGEYNTAIQGGQDVTGDGEWVYFPEVYASMGQRVGSNCYFRLVVHADEGLNSRFKNAFQVIASSTTGTTPTEITEIRSFAYSWSVDLRVGDIWHYYPFVPDTASGTDELDLFYNDMDTEGPYWLYDSFDSLVDNTVTPGNGSWSSDTDGTTNYAFGSQINSTWHVRLPVGGAGPTENTAEIWAENSTTNETLKIYSQFYQPDEAYRVSAYHDPTDTSAYTVTLQVEDSNGNSVPYVRNIYIDNPSSTMTLLDESGGSLGLALGESYTITTNSDGFAVFTCTDSVDETVTLDFITDGVTADNAPLTCSRLPTSGALGVNDSVDITFVTGNLPSLTSNGVAIIEGNASGAIDFSIEDVDGGFITAGNNIAIAIPDSVDAVFDNTITNPVLGGAASGNIANPVTYSVDDKTLYVDVTSDFSAGDIVSISGLAFTAVNTGSSGDFELSYSGQSGPYNVVDDNSSGYDIVITPVSYYVWDGDTDGDLTDNTNWDGDILPPNITTSADSKVILTGTGSTPLLDVDYYFKELIINTDAQPEASGTITITVSDTFQNNGILEINGVASDVTFAGSAFTDYPTLGDVYLNGTGASDLNYPTFDDLTLNAGTWTLPDFGGSVSYVINGDMTLGAGGTLTHYALTYFNFYGDWINSGATITNLLSAEFMGTDQASVTGATSFFQFICTEPGKRILFDTANDQTVTNLLRLTGSSSNPIYLRGTTSALWTIDNQTSVLDISYIDVDYAEAITADITCDYSTIGGNCLTDGPGGIPEWTTSGTVYTWVGGSGTGVGTVANWLPATGPPGAGDSVIIGAGSPDDPLLTGNWNLGTGNVIISSGGNLDTDTFTVTCDDFAIEAGGVLDLTGATGGTITSTTLTNDGEIRAQSDSAAPTAAIGTSGTVRYAGAGAALPLGNSYYNLILDGAAWTAGAALGVNNDLTVAAGSFDTSGNVLTLTGDIYITGGALDIDSAFTLNGDLLNTAGTFTATGNTITIAGGTHQIYGSNSWNNFDCPVGSAGAVIRFEDGTTQTVGGTFNVAGAAGNLTTLTGTGSGSWNLGVTGGGGSVTVSYADISYSTASAAPPYEAYNSQSTNNGNVDWYIFSGATAVFTWEGDVSPDWNTPGNWDTGQVPIATADVTIPNVVGPNVLPVLDVNTPALDDIVLAVGASLTTGDAVNQYNLTAATIDIPDGAELVVTGRETLTITTMDTDSGTVRYIDGGADGTLHFSGGPFDYNNLEIDGAGNNYALAGATTTRNNLTITAGTLAAAANNLSIGGAFDNQAAYTSTTGDITVTGDSILDGTITSSGAANHAFSGGISSLAGSVSTVGVAGTIDASGFSANLTLTGLLDAGTGTVTIVTGINSILDDADGGAVDITANTIDLGGTTAGAIGTVGNPLETSSAAACAMSLYSGNVSAYIDHTGIMTPGFGGNRTTAGAVNLSLTSTLGMNLPAASITNTGTGTIDLIAGNGGVGTLDLPAACTVSTADGDLTLSGDLVTLNPGAGIVDATGSGSIAITATAGALAVDKQVASGTGDVILTAYGAISQTQPITANLLTALTIDDAGALINLNNGANDAANVDLRSQDTSFATEIGNITYTDTNAFTLDMAETTGNMTFTAGGAVTLGAALDATGVLTLTAADLNDGGFDITTAGNVDLTFTGATTALGNTWNFTGTTAFIVNTNPLSLNDVQIGINGNLAFTGGVSQDIAGDFAVTGGGTTSLDITNDTLTIGGATVNLTNLDTLTNTGSTVTLDSGAAQAFTSAGLALNNLVINGAGATLNDPLSLDGDLTLTAGDLSFQGFDVTVTGTLFNNTNISLTGDVTQNISFGTGDTDSGSFTYYGAGTGLGDLTNFYDLIFTGAANRIIPGDITVFGDLNANAATGTFDLSTNTVNVTFDGTGGNFEDPATPANFTFYDLTIAAGRTLTAAGDMVIARNWTKAATGVFTPGAFGVTFVNNGLTSVISGSTTFNNFSCSTDNKTIQFTDGTTQTIGGVLTLQGSAAGLATMVHLEGTGVAGWTLNNTGASENIDFTTVEYGQVAGANDIAADNSVDVDGTCDITSPGWSFTVKTVTWDGSGGTNWDTGASWDFGYPPNSTDTVIIADVANQPIISTRNITVDDLTIQDSGSGSLQINDGWDLTMTTAFDNQGELIRMGNNTISRTDVDSGRTIYRGTGGVIQDYGGGDDYFALEIENAMTLGADLRVQDDLFIDGGSLDVTGANHGITLDAGDWINTGTFTGQSGLVTMTAVGDISGMGTALPGTDNNFYNLTVSGGARTSSNNLVVRNQLQTTGGTLTMSGVTTLDANSILVNGGDLTTNDADAVTTVTVTNGTFLVTNGDTLTAGGLMLVNGAGGTLDTRGVVNANGAMTVSNGTFTAGNALTDTVNITGDLNQSGGLIDGLANLDISGQALLSAGTLEGVNRTINVAGNWTESGTFVFDISGGASTVVIDGAGTITTRAVNDFDSLTVNNAAAVLGSTVRCNDDFSLTGTGSLDVTALNNYAMTVSGNWSRAATATFNPRSGRVTFDNTGSVSGMDAVGATNNFYDLTVSGGVRTSGSDVQIQNDLLVSGGTFDTDAGNDTLTVGNDLTVNGGDLTTDAVTVSGASTITSGTFTVSNGSAFSSTGLITVDGAAGTLTTQGAVTAGAGITLSAGTFTAGNGAADIAGITGNLSLSGTAIMNGLGRVNVSGNYQQTNGTQNGTTPAPTPTLDIEGDFSLTGGTFDAGDRIINVAGNWTETTGFDTTGGTSTVVLDTGVSVVNMVSDFDTLTASANVTLNTNITCANNLNLSGTAIMSSTTQNISVAGNVALTGTSQISITGTGAVDFDGDVSIGAGTTLNMGLAANTLGDDAAADTVSVAGTITSTGTAAGHTILITADFDGTGGTLTGSAAGDPGWFFDGNIVFATVNMDGDDVEFTNAVASHDCTPGAIGAGFDLIVIPDNVSLNLLGGGTLRANSLQIGTAASAPGDYDNGAVFDANSVNFVIGSVDNGGVFSLTGNQTNPNQDITAAFDNDSGWLEYDGGAATLDNPDFNDVWNLRVQSGNYTLGQDLTINGNGPDRDTDTIAYNDEGLLLNGGTFNGGAGGYVITLYEMFSTSGGGTFVSGDSHVLITGPGDGFIDAPAAGTITFYQLTCNYVAFDFSPPAIAADLSVSAKNLFFNPNTTTAVTGYLALSGNQATAPSMDEAPSYDLNGSTYLQLMPTSDPASPTGPIAANEYWRLDVQPGAQLFMENLAAWYSDATSNPFVTQTRVEIYECIGWLDYVEVLTSQTLDSDDNGKIDRILITVGVGLLQGASAYSGFEATVSGYSVTGYTDGAVTDEFYIELQENGSLDTDATPTLQITANTTLLDSATSTKLVVIPPYTVDNSSTQVVADTAEPVIGYTLAVPENDQVFVHFSEPVETNGGGAIDETDFNLTGFSQAATGVTPVTTSGAGTEEVLIDFAGNLTMTDCLDATVSMQVASQFQDMAAIPNFMDNSLARNTAHPATDILAGPTNNGPVEPLWAIDQTRASGSASGAGTGVINDFDGSQHLKDEDISLQAHLSSDIPAANLASDIELRFVQDPGYSNGNNLWMDDAYYAESDWSGLVPYLISNTSVTSSTGTMNATNNQVWDFALSGGNISNSKDLHFLFYLDLTASTNRYAGRISDHTASNWYRLVYPWSFGVHDIVDQGAGVSILNNIINPQQGETTTLYYDLSKGGMVSVQVFDLAGGLVEILHRGRQEAGEYSLVWNGTNRSGNYVARGIYFVRLVGPGVDEMRKVMVIK